MKSLVVDDDPTICQTMVKILEKYGPVEVANDGRKGLELFKSAAHANDNFDLITMDIEMPYLNGQQTLQQIRDFEKSLQLKDWEKTYIIMVTSLSDYENVRPSFLAGCEAYIVKPINKDELVNKLLEMKLIDKA